MSFRCEECGQSQESGTTPNMVVIETRDMEYSNRGSFSLGKETVSEKKMCGPCTPKDATEPAVSTIPTYEDGTPVVGMNTKTN